MDLALLASQVGRFVLPGRATARQTTPGSDKTATKQLFRGGVEHLRTFAHATGRDSVWRRDRWTRAHKAWTKPKVPQKKGGLYCFPPTAHDIGGTRRRPKKNHRLQVPSVVNPARSLLSTTL